MKIQSLIFIFTFTLAILFGNSYTLTINASTVTNEETTWTVYESSRYGLSFEYPSKFVTTELEGDNPLFTVLLSNPIGSNTPSLNLISFSIYQGNNTLENFVNEELTSYVAEEGMVVGKAKPVMILQNTPALAFDSFISASDPNITKNIVFKANNYLYTLSYTDSKDQFRSDIYNHILNSMKISSIAG